MDKKNTITVPPAEVRNPFALHAKQRKAGYMKDRRQPRGGNTNKQRDLREED